MRPQFLAAGAAVAIAALVVPAAAAAPTPHITDQAGDANVANGQGLVTGGGADGTPTPASYGPADLLSVTYSTSFVTEKIGEDGFNYIVTGLEARIATTEAAKSDGPTLIYRLNADVGGCGGFIDYYLSGPASAPIDLKGLTFRKFTTRGCNASATITPTGWSAAQEGKTLVLKMPFGEMTPADRLYFANGKSVSTTAAEVRTVLVAATAPAIDITGAGTSFKIGSDVPKNVPCTIGCPETP